MKFQLPFVLAAALTLAAGGTLAQQANQNKGAMPNQASTSSDKGAKTQAMTQGKLKQSLEKAGFTNVRIVDAQYLVHARTEDGNPVVMFINPPSSATAQAGQTDSSANPSQTPSSQKK